MNAKEFIYNNSKELSEAIDNGYDLRMSEPEILYWMEKYAAMKLKEDKQENELAKSSVSGSACICDSEMDRWNCKKECENKPKFIQS